MDFRLSDSPATSIGIAVGAVLSFLLLLAMMPGLFLVTLLSGGSTTMPVEDLLICQDTLSWPLTDYGTECITSPFGLRSSPGGIGSTDHKGIDIGVPAGTKILAAGDGTVTISAYNLVMGNYVEIDHGNGIKTRYEHMQKRLCSVGDVVSSGDVIGKVGSTGVSTGAHLHFEVRLNDKPYNPIQVFS